MSSLALVDFTSYGEQGIGKAHIGTYNLAGAYAAKFVHLRNSMPQLYGPAIGQSGQQVKIWRSRRKSSPQSQRHFKSNGDTDLGSCLASDYESKHENSS